MGQSTLYCDPLREEVIHLQIQGAKYRKETMPGKHKEVSFKICYKTMRSDAVKRHMKVHEKANKQICGEVLDVILDKMFEQEESTTEIKHNVGEHDAANCQPSKKRKFNEIEVCTHVSEEMIKRLIKDDEEYKYNVACGKQIYEEVNKYGIKEESLCPEYKELLDVYMKQRNMIDIDNVILINLSISIIFLCFIYISSSSLYSGQRLSSF